MVEESDNKEEQDGRGGYGNSLIFEEMGLRYLGPIDGHDLQAFADAFAQAKANDNGKPKLIIAKTEIGRGIPEVAGTAKGHGEGGAKFAESARAGLGLPPETFYVSDEVRAFFAGGEAAAGEDMVEWVVGWVGWCGGWSCRLVVWWLIFCSG